MFPEIARPLAVTLVTLIAATGPALAARHGVSPEVRFKAADQNHDGNLDRAEAKTLSRVANHFDGLDTDHDGTLSMVELRASLKAKRSGHA